jgi:hypothetical protein
MCLLIEIIYESWIWVNPNKRRSAEGTYSYEDNKLGVDKDSDLLVVLNNILQDELSINLPG